MWTYNIIQGVNLLKVIIICVLFSFILTLSVDEASAQTACLFAPVNFSETPRLDIFRDVIRDALAVELKLAGYRLVPSTEWQKVQKEKNIQDKELVYGPVAINLAEEVGADIAVTSFIRIENREILLGIKCYDIAGKSLCLSLLNKGVTGLLVYNLINDTSRELITGLKEPLFREDRKRVTVKEISYEHKIVEMGEVIQVTLLSRDEGAEVYLAGDKYIGNIENGKLSFSAKADTRLILVIRKPGYHEASREFKLKDTDKELKLPSLNPVTHMAVEVEYSSFQFLGAGAAYRFYLVPDKYFLRADNYFYMQYPFLPGASPVVHNDIQAQIGAYVFLPPYSRVRIGIAGGVGVILTSLTKPLSLYTDFYFSPLNYWIEFKVWKWVLFYKHEIKYAVGIGRDLLGTGMMSDYGPTQTIGVIWKW